MSVISSFAKYLPSTCIFVVLFFTISMVGSVTATSLSALKTEDLPFPIATFPESEFTTWAGEMIIPASSSLPAVLLKPTLPPEWAEFSLDTVSIDGLSEITALQRLPSDPYSSIPLSFFDLPHSATLPGTTETFPLLEYDSPSAQYDVFSDIPIPEPNTLVLLLTALGGIYGYQLWQHRKHGSAQSFLVAIRRRFSDHHPQADRRALLEQMAGERTQDVHNTLTTIHTCADILGYDDLQPDERMAWTRILASEVEWMRGMTQDLLRQKESLRRELRRAHHIQQALLPPPFTTHAAIRFDAVSVPEMEVGGDFYDYFPVNEHEFAFFIGDVCGQGIPAAIVMASAHSLLKAQALADPHPTRVISQVNHLLATEVQDEMFVTVFYGVYNTDTHTLRFTNAGHPPGLLLCPSSTSCASLYNHNLPLGILAPAPFETTVMPLAPGDRLVLYTDGISDAVNARGERFGGARIVACLQAHETGSLNALQETIMQDVKTFHAGQDQQDDMTVLIVQV